MQTACLLLGPGANAGAFQWQDPVLVSNMQALVASFAQTNVGAGLRVEDAEQGQGTVVAGMGQLEPAQAVRPGDRFRIASCSKTFTAAAVFLLKEQGLVDFDVPIARYLPQYELPRKDIITIRHLITHTSGLPDFNNETNFVSQEQNPLVYFSPTQICAAISSMTNHFMPGTDWSYSDSGFYLLHLIIAGVNTNGWSYQQFIERKFIQPLGLTNTFVPGPDNNYLTTIPGDHLRGYMLDESGQWYDATEWNQSFDVGCGGMVSCLQDLCTWGRALFTGQVISTNSLAEMRQVTPQSLARNSPYGMGVAVSPILGYGHSGGTAGYLTRFSWDPVRQTAYATVLNVLGDIHSNPAGMLAWQAKHVLGYPDTFPALAEGQTTTGTLTANQTAWYQFNAAPGVYYGVWLTNSSTNIQLTLRAGDSGDNLQAPTSSGRLGWTCPNGGSYYLGLNATSNTPYGMRLYTLTNTIARLSNLVTNLMAQNNLVGCGLSLVDNGQTVWKTGFGYADRERDIPADEGTVFMIGSCSKTFGAIAAMQLAEEGLLELDAPFTNALPSFSIHQRFADSIITPRTILTHHSGVPGDLFNHGFTCRPNYDAPDQLQAILADEYTLMPADTIIAYNNSGFVMLGQAFRHLTGQDLPAFARSRLFDRMGMDHSSIVYDLPCIKERLSRPYADGEVNPTEYCNLFFAGSIYSTAEDMARYMNMLLNGGMGERARVLSQASLEAMATRSDGAIPLDQFNLGHMGIGFVLDPPALSYMGKVIWHNGGTIYFRTLMRLATDAQLGCFISCNSAEASDSNEQIVNSALQWAYEEKTGIAPPPPGGPGTPLSANAPPETLALATGGDFVTSSGCDRFETNALGLLAHFNAQVPGQSDQQLVYRENGWFTPTNAYEPQYSFTQCVGHVVCLLRTFPLGITSQSIRGERAANIDGFASAWNQRLGRWWTTDMDPNDLSWLMPGAICYPMMELYTSDSHLELATQASRSDSTYVLSATNDGLAFAAGLGRNKGTALRVLADGQLAFLGVHYQAEAAIPVLAPDCATNGLTLSNEVCWLRLSTQPGAPLTVDLATERDITAYLYDTNCAYLGQANRAHTFHLPAGNAVPLMAAIVRNGTNTGPWRLALHTQAVPFYQEVPFDQWPTQLAANSNLFPRTSFGYVFVPENHSVPSGNVLKLAVAKMASTNAAAPQPLIFCSGGPGNWSIFSMYQHELKTYFSDYDVYLPDQRGVGFSQPNLDNWPGESANETLYRLRFLSGGDYTTMHTAESALDLMDIHAALGLGSANVWGLSYGTMLAEELMRQNPAWLRAVVLDGILAPNCPPYVGVGEVTDHALANLFADVAADPLACRYYPNFEQTFREFAAALQEHPLEWVANGHTNRVNGTTFLTLTSIAFLFNDLGNRHLIPALVWRAMHGDPAALVQLAQLPGQTAEILDNGYTPLMNSLVLRHDFAPFESLADVTNADACLWSPLREYANNFAFQDLGPALSLPDVGSASLSYTQALSSTVATLCINGLYDPQTGTNWAAEVARQLPNSQLALVPTVGHQTLLGGECPRRLVRDFLQNPSQPLDTSCLAAMKLSFPAPWPTNTPAIALGGALAGTLDASTSSQWYQIQPASPSLGLEGLTNLFYQVKLDGAPADFRLRLYDSATGSPVAERTGNGGLLVGSGASPLLLNVVAEAQGSSTGAYNLSFTLPLLIRDLRPSLSAVTLLWQGPTNGLLTIEATSRLGSTNAFEPVLGHIPATNLLQRQSIPGDPTTNRFYRLRGD